MTTGEGLNDHHSPSLLHAYNSPKRPDLNMRETPVIIEAIKAKDAPAPTPAKDDFKTAFITALRSLKAGQVLRITPEPGKTVRGTKQALGRFAAGGGIRIETWEQDNVIYVKQIGFVTERAK